MTRRAFTFIEVMMAVALIGLLAGATAWSLAEQMRHGSTSSVIGRILHLEKMARLAAQRMDKEFALRWDLGSQRLIRRESPPGDGGSDSHALRIPRGYRIDRILTAASTGVESSESGVVEISFSTAGRSVTYAVHLAFETAADSHDTQPHSDSGGVWLVFSGLTGQATQIHEQKEIDSLFSLLAAGRPDAH